jgi:GT2 family glycosyltransferase
MSKNKDVGAATCKGILENGKMDWGYHRGLPTPWASFNYYFLHNDYDYHLSYKNMEEEHEVDAISGSFFMTRKSVLNKVGLFDEDYWMYAEDIDLCYRMKKFGYRIMFVPVVMVTHIKGVSSGIKLHSENLSAADKLTKIKAFNSFYETMKIFYRKNLAKNYPFLINWLVILGINIKWFLASRKMKV